MGVITVISVTNTLTPRVADYFGHHARVVGNLSLSASYVAGGDTYTPQQFGLGLLEDLWIYPVSISGGVLGYILVPTLTSEVTGGKVQLFVSGTAGTGLANGFNEAANGNYSTVIARFNAWGV